MTKKPSSDRTALVLVPGDLESLDRHFKKLTKKPHEWVFESNPSHPPKARVLLGSFGPQGAGGLCVFVGMLTGCKYRRLDKTLTYQRVTRFWCPVVAAYGNRVRDDLLGDRELWGPHEFNYVLPAALEQVPREAEAMLLYDARQSVSP